MKHAILFLSLVLPLAFFAGTVLAQEEGTSPRDAFKDRVIERREAAQGEFKDRAQEARQDALCKAVEARVNNRTNWYESGRDRHVETYNRAIGRIEDLVAKLEARGCDPEHTALVTTHLTTLDEMVDEFTSRVDTLKGDLDLFRDAVCDGEAGNHTEELAQVRTQAAAVREQTDAISDFYLGTLRSSIRTMGEACKAARPSPTTLE